MAAVDREQAIAAFAKVATESEQAAVVKVAETVSTVVQTALRIEVRTAEEAQQATEFLAQIAGAKKRSEEARSFLVKPLKDHAKAIEARFKAELAPLEEADGVVREKVLAYRREQERLRREEEARLEAEYRERERQAEEQRRAEAAEAQRQREAAAREAARAEAEARESERKRQEEIREQADAQRQAIAESTDEMLRAWAADPGEPAHMMALDEIDARRRAREAKERAAAARQAEEDARRAEEEARNRPLPEIPRAHVVPAAKLAAQSGSISERKRWVATVVHPASVPREYLKVDETAINAAVRRGVRAIPGVRIEQIDELAVRAR